MFNIAHRIIQNPLGLASKVVHVPLRPRNYGVYPNPCRGIGGCLQMVTPLLRLHNKRAMRPTTLGGVQVVQIHLINRLQENKESQLISQSQSILETFTHEP